MSLYRLQLIHFDLAAESNVIRTGLLKVNNFHQSMEFFFLIKSVH